MNYPQEYENISIFTLDDLNEKENNSDKIQTLFKRGGLINLSISIISEDYYELPKKTVTAKRKILHVFKPNNFRDVQNLYQHKVSMDMTLNEYKYLNSTCWNEKYQPLIIDMSEGKYTGN